MSYVCKYDISVPCNDKSIYSCDMCKEHPMYEQGRADKYQEITSGYMLLTEKQVAEIRADAIEEFVKALEEHQQKNWVDNLEYGITFADIEEVAEELKEKKND